MLRALRVSPRVFSRGIVNYYKLFPHTLPQGPPPKGKFDVDPKELRNEYLKLQQKSHPDVSDGSQEVDAATIGNAYRTLSDPLLRSQHILKLNGIDPLSEATALHNEDLLMDIMMIREEAQESDSPEVRERLTADNQARIKVAVDRIKEAFAADDLEEAHNATIELSYWLKLEKTLEEME